MIWDKFIVSCALRKQQREKQYSIKKPVAAGSLMTQMEEFVKVNNPDGEGAYKQRMATHGISLVSVGLPSLTASLQGSLYFSNTWQCAIVSVLIQFKLSYLSLS